MSKVSIKLLCAASLFLLTILMIASGQAFSPRVVDLDKGEENIRILGDDAGDIFGNAVAVADINGDGNEDLLISSACADSNTGEVYVFFGKDMLPSSIDLDYESADMIIHGANTGDYFGAGICSGDVNGDGYDDLIIGGWGVDTPGGSDSGATYVIFGGNPPARTTVDLSSESADMTILGRGGGNAGLEVSSGDINNDGFDDIIIGANRADPGGRTDAGETFVVFGSAAPPASIDLNSTSADITILGANGGDQSGVAVGSGDINGDGYDDVIIGAYGASPFGRSKAGESYVIFGENHFSQTIIDLSSESPDMILYGADANDFSGNAVGSGNINNDNYDDLIIGAWDASPAGGSKAGEAYVIFGSAAPPTTFDLNSESPDMILYGDNAGDEFGRSVASGDINDDNYDDVIIGAYGGDKAYVIYGGDPPPRSVVDLNSESADVTILGDDSGDWCGWALDSGDVNKDGCDDILLGAHYADPGSRIDAGESYVVFGTGLPLEFDFSDTDISDWERKGRGIARVKEGQLLLRRTSSNFRLFPKGASAEKCTIEAKITRAGGNLAKVSSSIFFSYKDNKNFWELRMELYSTRLKKTGKWILQHKKDGMYVEQHSIADILNRDQQYLLNIEIIEEQIIIKVDDVEKINIFLRGNKPTWGKIALGSAGPGKSLFDDLKIY